MENKFVINETKKHVNASDAYVVMYYEHQYDRIKTLEEQRLNITNIVLTVSVVAFTFGFSNPNVTSITGIILPLVIILFNLFAIVFINNCDTFIDLHQSRATRILEYYAQEIDQLNKSLPWPQLKPYSDRKTMQVSIHVIVIIVALIPIILYLLN